MKFDPDGPSIPDILLERCDAGRVVFLCGAGVSFPSGMPTFVGLTKHVIDFFDPPANSEIMTAFRPWLSVQSAANVPLDQIFNLLHLEYGKDEVNSLVTQRLSAHLGADEVGREHRFIKRISSSQNGIPQIVTTNFDRLFEIKNGTEVLNWYAPPAFPDINFGSKIEGITYLHGRLVETTSDSHPYVLSSADFGRAYLSEGWATNFVRNLLERYTVVMVGYQAEDPPIKYLLQGLNHDGQYDRSKLYAFDRGLPDDIEAKWRDRGVTAIAYSDHPDLWRTMEAWADRADNPRKWRTSIVQKSLQDPKELLAHERGQVAHILRTVQGARLFAEAVPTPHPEWVCVMDANVRSAKQSRDYGNDAETFVPSVAYGLDDDLRDISASERKQGINNDNILAWRENDDSPHDFHQLSGRPPEGFESTPTRLGHLITWISKSIDSPVLAWWAIRQNGLHPRLLQQIEWQLDKVTVARARHIWNLILEHHRDPRNREWDGQWFDFKKRVNTEGWTESVLRDFRRITTPRLEIRLPFGLNHSRPPSEGWDIIKLANLGEFEVISLERHNEYLNIPDDFLPQVFGILEEQLTVASGLLRDVETVYFEAPTCYPTREVEGKEHITKSAEVAAWFIQLFDQMAATRPELAKAHAITWSATDPFFFRKLKIYSLNKENLFTADQAAEEILSFNPEEFWDIHTVRELLFFLCDRWRSFSQKNRNRLMDRILIGPDQPRHWSAGEFDRVRVELSARYARYLELQGCHLTGDQSRQVAEMIASIDKWHDARATSIVIERGSRSGWVGTDEKPDAILNLPASEVISRAKEDLKLDFDNFTEKRPFVGLVKANPRKALSALTIAGRAGDYPETFWSSIIDDLPTDIRPRLKRVFLHRVARLPYATIISLRHTLGRWVQRNLAATLQFDEYLGWMVYDHVVNGILSGGAHATRSGLGEVHRDGELVQQSRRTYNHAINGPMGMCAQGLLSAIPENESTIPGQIKCRVERLLVTSGESSDHAVSIACASLNWLMHLDPAWTKEHLIPMLALEHHASEPAWNGFLHNSHPPQTKLAEIIKPFLLQLFPWINERPWNQDLSTIAAQWLGYMRIFRPDEPNGLSRNEMRSTLRLMSSETRNRFIFWLGLVGKSNEDGWEKYVIPLINYDWPRERQHRTSTSMRAWIGMLDDTNESFPLVYEAVKRFLVPAEKDDHPFYRFTRASNDDNPITVLFPEATLDLINRTTPATLSRPPYELPKVLALIAETDPNLTSDPRYLRLIDLIEQS